MVDAFAEVDINKIDARNIHLNNNLVVLGSWGINVGVG